MAIRAAIASGNWSSPSTWTGGIVPTSADDVQTNTFIITVDGNYTVISVLATNGGRYDLSTGGVSLTLTGTTPIFQSTANNAITITNTTGTVTLTTNSNITAQQTTAMILHSSAGTFNFNCPQISSAGSNATILLSRTGTGTLNFTGNITSGTGTAANTTFNNSGSGTINISGSITGGNSTNACQGLVTTNATVNITGNVTAGSGNILGYAVNNSSALIVTGIITGTSARAIVCTSTITIYGNILTTGSGAAIISSADNTLTITGNVTSSATGSAVVFTGTNPSITLIGNFTNTSGRQAIYSQVLFISNSVTTTLTYNTPGGSSRILYSDDTFPNLPAVGNVRFGTTYGPGLTNTGTLRVPSPSVVLLGNLTDNTTGTLLMTPADFVTELNTSSTAVAVRLRNCATVATTGDQVASYGV